MNKERLIVAFDTSNYTTSCSVCTESGTILQNLKLPLPVAQGQRGLRQSDALFHHINHLPQLMDKLELYGEVAAVGFSATPREVEGSYMPCFLAGKAVATSFAKAKNVPLYSFSHQNGHIMAALYSAGRIDLIGESFYAFHVSGGTTEVLLVIPDKNMIISSKNIGGTLDLNAGQVIDRIGVLMGMSFPCGREMELLASAYNGKIDPYKVSVKDIHCNLSGIENLAVKLYDQYADKSRVAAFVINSVKKTLETITQNLFENYGKLPVIYAGGVMSCSLIRKDLSKYGDFSLPEFSSDNAAGCALLTRYCLLKNEDRGL